MRVWQVTEGGRRGWKRVNRSYGNETEVVPEFREVDKSTRGGGKHYCGEGKHGIPVFGNLHWRKRKTESGGGISPNEKSKKTHGLYGCAVEILKKCWW